MKWFFQYNFRSQLYYLAVGGLMHLFVGKLYPQFVDVESDIGMVVNREVNEKVFSHSIDVVQPHLHLMLLGSDITAFGRRVPHLRAKLYISSVDIDTAGFLYAVCSEGITVLSVTASVRRVV